MVCLGQLGRVSEHIVKMSTLPKDNPRSAPRCVNIVVSLVGRVFHQYVFKRRVDRQRVTDRQWVVCVHGARVVGLLRELGRAKLNLQTPPLPKRTASLGLPEAATHPGHRPSTTDHRLAGAHDQLDD